MSSLRRWQTLALKHWSEWWQRPKLLAFLKQLQVELQRCWQNACKNACSRWTVQEALEAKMIEQAQQGELIKCRWASTCWHNSSRLQRVTLQPGTTNESRQGNTSQSMQRGKRAKQVGRSQVASIAGIADQCWSPSSCHPASQNVMTFMWLAHTCFNSHLYFFVSLIVLKVEILYLEIKSGVTCNDSCKVQTYLFTVLFKVFHGVPLWLLPTETPHWRTPSLNMAPKASEQSLLSLRWVVLVQFRGAGRKIAQPAQCGIDSSPPHQLSSYKLTNWRRQTIPLRLSANWKLCKFQNTCFNMDFWALLFLPCAGWATLLWKWSF